MSSSDTTRRQFLKQSAETVTIAAAATALGGVHTFGAESPTTLRLGIIGCGGIMTTHVKGLVGRRENMSIAWLCDVDSRQIERMAGFMTGFQSAPAKRTSR